VAKPVRLILYGAGMRGDLDLGYHVSQRRDMVFVGVAEPDEYRRQQFARRFHIPPENTFATWQELVAKPRFADAVINALPCSLHYPSTVATLAAGYHMLLEKPMAHTPGQCVALVRLAKKNGRVLAVSLENRFNAINREIAAALRQNRIGRLVNISCAEDIGYYHFAMSYVRGGHRLASDNNSFMIAKGIHDLDLLSWWAQAPAAYVSSFGGLSHFTPENAPAGAPERCIHGCPVQKDCIFDAVTQYLRPGKPAIPLSLLTNTSARCLLDVAKNRRFRTLAGCIVRDISPQSIRKELEEGTHGKCVYRSDNGVADHQSTSIEFERGITCSYSLSAFSMVWERNTVFNGTEGELRAADFSGRFEVRRFFPAKVHRKRIRYHSVLHGGGDVLLLGELARAVRGEPPDPAVFPTAEQALEGHLLALAAEEARRSRTVVSMAEVRRRAEAEADAILEDGTGGASVCGS